MILTLNEGNYIMGKTPVGHATILVYAKKAPAC
jgi:hypothetical protein